MRNLVFASFPDDHAARDASRSLGARGFLLVGPDSIRAACEEFGLRPASHLVGVSTRRAETAGEALRDLGAPRVRTVPHVAVGDDLPPEPVDQAGRESFPASDPPPWTR